MNFKKNPFVSKFEFQFIFDRFRIWISKFFRPFQNLNSKIFRPFQNWIPKILKVWYSKKIPTVFKFEFQICLWAEGLGGTNTSVFRQRYDPRAAIDWDASRVDRSRGPSTVGKLGATNAVAICKLIILEVPLFTIGFVPVFRSLLSFKKFYKQMYI